MATLVFVDTGAHYALADVQDPDHARVLLVVSPPRDRPARL